MIDQTVSTVLIVGGNGLIGSNLVRQMAERGINVISYSYNQPVKRISGCTYYTGDVCEYGTLNRIFQSHKIDCVIHNAAISSPSLFLDNPYKIYRVNVDGLLTSVEAANQNGVRRFVYISSDAVYGYANNTVDEESPLRPEEAYGSSKAACEYILANYGDMQTVSLRVGTVYGPNRKINCPINTMILKALKGETVRWYCSGESQDFVYEDDVISGILAVSLAEKWKCNVYNIGGWHSVTLRETVELLQEILEPCDFIEDKAYRLNDFSSAELCTKRIEEEFGWHVQVPFREGLRRCVAGLKAKQI